MFGEIAMMAISEERMKNVEQNVTAKVPLAFMNVSLSIYIK